MRTSPRAGRRPSSAGRCSQDVLAAAGAEGEKVTVRAMDGYAVEVPLEEMVGKGAVVALERDGKALGIGGFGPTQIVFPRGERADLKDMPDDWWIGRSTTSAWSSAEPPGRGSGGAPGVRSTAGAYPGIPLSAAIAVGLGISGAGTPMDHFSYRGGVLSAEAVPLTAIAAAVGTPVYVYSSRRPSPGTTGCSRRRWPGSTT